MREAMVDPRGEKEAMRYLIVQAAMSRASVARVSQIAQCGPRFGFKP